MPTVDNFSFRFKVRGMSRPPPLPARPEPEPDPFPAPPRAPSHLGLAARTDIGRERARNEDRAGFVDLDAGRAFEPPAEAELGTTHGPIALLVCDGMGGEAGGQIASALAIEAIARGLVARHEARPLRDDDALADACVRSVLDASAHVRTVGRAEPRYARMGTTATLAALVDQTLVVAQVGDSRAYLLRRKDRRLLRLTRDQTFLELVRAAGGGPPIDEDGHPVGANVILQAVGSASPLDVVVSRAMVAPGDVVLLCSDGLHGVVDDARLAAILDGAPDPATAADALVAAALAAGAPDNVSCVVAKVEG